MASTSGTATNYLDLLTLLKTFLTTDATLVAANQGWTALKDVTNELALPDSGTLTPERHIYFRGPGLSQSDEIHVNIRAYRDPSDINYHNWDVRSAVGFDSLESFDDQPAATPIQTSGDFGGPRLLLSDTSMNYWFIANGRRFIVIADVNGTWSSMYGGFYLPYATPSEMPYPMYVAGNGCKEALPVNEASDFVASFWDPAGVSATSPSTNCGYLRDFNGTWRPVSNYISTSGITRSNITNGTTIWPYNYFHNEDLDDDITKQNDDGSTTVLPCILLGTLDGGNVFGELDGVMFMSGVARSPADTLTIGSDTYLVVRSSFRQNPSFDYVAINLA